jgi:hypothetical protein
LRQFSEASPAVSATPPYRAVLAPQLHDVSEFSDQTDLYGIEFAPDYAVIKRYFLLSWPASLIGYPLFFCVSRLLAMPPLLTDLPLAIEQACRLFPS